MVRHVGEKLISTTLRGFAQFPQQATDNLLVVLDSLPTDRDSLVLGFGAPDDLKIRFWYIKSLDPLAHIPGRTQQHMRQGMVIAYFTQNCQHSPI